MNVLLRVVFILLALACAGDSYAQQALLRHFTIKDGLPSNVVYNIHQDRKGFIWFFTDQGVSQFDGHRFLNYGINEGLPDNEVFNMGEDNYGRLWLVCYNRQPCYILNGQVYNSQNDKLCREIERLQIHYTLLFVSHNGINCLEGDRVCALYQDSIAIAYPEINDHDIGGAQYTSIKGSEYFVRGNKIHIKTRSAKKVMPFREIEGSVHLSVFNRDQILLISVKDSINTLYQYHLDADAVRLISSRRLPGFCYAVQYESDSSITCSTAKGIYRYSLSTRSLHKLEIYPDAKPFNKLLKDSEGNIWLGTLNDGAFMRVGDQAYVYNVATGLLANNVFSLNSQSDGKIIASFSDGGFSIIDGRNVVSIRLPVSGNLNRLLFAYQLSAQDFLVGSDRGLYRLGALGYIKQLVSEGAQKACQQKGDLYYVAFSGGAISYNSLSGEVTTLWQQRTTAIASDNASNVWMGTLNGLYLYNKGNVRKFDRDSTLSNSRITSLTYMAGNRLIIATHKSGLYVLDGIRLTNIDKATGLSSNSCNRITADSAGRLWVCTDKGLDRISFGATATPAIYHYTASDGLPTNKVADVAVSRGLIYIATADGIVLLKKNRGKADLQPPKVYILSVATHDTVLNYPEKPLTLSYNQNDLQIAYTAISLSSGSDLQYRYVLEGGSNDTVYTRGSTLNLSAIKPGDYRLVLWAKVDGDHNWSKLPASFPFTIRPPFWRTTWFLFLASCVIVLLAAAAYLKKVRSVRRAEREKSRQRQRMAELEMQALRAQINPHFMFNALNSIQHFYTQDNERKANHYMSLFAQLIRKTLNHSQNHWMTLAEELEMLTTYIDLEQMRFKNAFEYEVFIDPDILPEKLKIPAMLIQPYVENAINHGLLPAQHERGRLILRFELADDTLRCGIDDNGIGIDQAMKARRDNHKAMGMEINRQRIETMNQIYKSRITVTVTDKATIDRNAHGTLVVIQIPDINLWTS